MTRVKVEYYESGALKSVETTGLFISGTIRLHSDDNKKPVVDMK